MFGLRRRGSDFYNSIYSFIAQPFDPRRLYLLLTGNQGAIGTSLEIKQFGDECEAFGNVSPNSNRRL
jgi:hypothetical protein